MNFGYDNFSYESQLPQITNPNFNNDKAQAEADKKVREIQMISGGLSEPLIVEGTRGLMKAGFKKGVSYFKDNISQAGGEEAESMAQDYAEGGMKKVISNGIKRNIEKARAKGESLSKDFKSRLTQKAQDLENEAKGTVKSLGDSEADKLLSKGGDDLLKKYNIKPEAKKTYFDDDDDEGDLLSNMAKQPPKIDTPDLDLGGKISSDIGESDDWVRSMGRGISKDYDNPFSLGGAEEWNRAGILGGKDNQRLGQVSEDVKTQLQNKSPLDYDDDDIPKLPDTTPDKPISNESGVKDKGNKFKDDEEDSGEIFGEGGGVEDPITDAISLGIGLTGLLGGIFGAEKHKLQAPSVPVINPSVQIGA